jgi:hypothetical protein
MNCSMVVIVHFRLTWLYTGLYEHIGEPHDTNILAVVYNFE